MTDAFRRFLGALGKSSTPEDLQRRGVRRVRSVSVREVARAIEAAINSALMERAANVSDDERRALVAAAEEHMAAWLAARGGKRAGDAEATEEPPAEGATLPVRLRAGRERETRLRERLEEIFREARETGRPPLVAEKLAVSAVLSALREASDEMARELAERGQTEVERLERRIEKLGQRLAEVERERDEARAGKGPVPTRHNAVGLDPEDPRREQKLGILKDVYETNADLGPRP